jgi:site-specific recombinase XerD
MASTRRKPGLLGSQIEGYRAWLIVRGYAPETVRNMLKDAGHVGRWLAGASLSVEDLDEARIGQFLAWRTAAGHRRIAGPRGMAVLLAFLRETGTVPAACVPTGALDVLIDRYRCWLCDERGLAPQTVLRYLRTARRFLAEQASGADGPAPEALTGAHVNAFLLAECTRVSTGSAKGRVAELRSLLRFLYLHGLTPMRLGSSVPPVGGWRLSALPPKSIGAGDVTRLLESCDRTSALGRRDFAMMTLLARLGLRSIEVARLELGDVDWRRGELLIRGKAARRDRMPLPVDVGQALVDCLRDRPGGTALRQVFLTQRAPLAAIRADLVGDVVERACRRAEVRPVGPHRLRHALARELLRQGAGLMAIGQVLRHQDLATTALYAKVELDALRAVAAPWPGVGR